MAGIKYLTYDEYIAIMVKAFGTVLPDIDPTQEKNFAHALTVAMATGITAYQGLIGDIETNVFPTTAKEGFLDDVWGAYEVLPRNLSRSASGTMAQPGTLGTNIPLDTLLTALNGTIYRTTKTENIINYDIGIIDEKLTSSSTVAYAKTAADHGLGNGMTVLISGADQTEYNGTFSVTVGSRNEFSYNFPGSATSPATGIISFSADYAVIPVIADTDFGPETNLGNGSRLSLKVPIVGIAESAYVTFDGLTGGADRESNEAYSTRIIKSRGAVEGVFTNVQIELAALTVEGNTRAFVINPSGTVCAGSPVFPVPGQVAIYILRDDSIPITPSPAQIEETKTAILEQGRLPAHSSELDVFVLAPILETVDFVFTSLSPDTPTMRAAVENTIKAFFEDNVNFASDVSAAAYNGAIQSTQDLSNNQFLKTFTLSAPVGDIIVTTGSIAIAGVVTFSV